MIGIFAQVRDEVATLLENVEILERKTVGSLVIYKVSYDNNVFYIILTGFGKVNSAFALGYAIEKLCIKKVIVVGNTASVDATTNPVGTLGISTGSVEWDVNYINLGYPANTVPSNEVSNYPVGSKLLRSALLASNGLGYTVNSGVYASGDTFVASSEQATQIGTATGANFIDTNTAALGQISYQMNIPYISVKGVSNNATETALTDYNTNKEAMNNLSNRVVLEMLETLFEEEVICQTNSSNTTNPTSPINQTIACPCNNRYINNFNWFW